MCFKLKKGDFLAKTLEAYKKKKRKQVGFR